MVTKRSRQKGKPPRRAKKNAAEAIRARNAVGSVVAREHARVSIRQAVYTQLSEVEEERRRQQSELRALEGAVKSKLAGLRQAVKTPPPAVANPYLFLQPFRVADARRFFGREELGAELTARLETSPVTFLTGDHGMGKTSLMRAGLAPGLFARGHLPLLVSVSGENIESGIKKELLPNVDDMPFLKRMSLAEFIRRAADCLPPGKRLAILLDDFELLFDQDAAAQASFYNEWKRCFNGAAAEARWLFCVPADKFNLLGLFKEDLQREPNTITVRPLERASARLAVRKPAAGRIQVDPKVIEAILDAIGGENVDPSELQLVCYMLAGGHTQLVTTWTMDYYRSLGEAQGILREYLDRSIQELDPEYQEPAWQLLAVLVDPGEHILTELQLITRMKENYGVPAELSRKVLAELSESHLIEHARAYRLANDGLRPRIEKWLEERSISERIGRETASQIRSIRNSALRGLIGGGIGFGLAYICLPYNRPTAWDASVGFYAYNTALRALFGGISGFLLILTLDIILASFNGKQGRLRLPLAGAAGAGTFALLLFVHRFLGSGAGSLDPLPLASSALEGALWGAVVGAGTAGYLMAQRRRWAILAGAVLAGGIVLALAENFLGGLEIASLPSVLLAGMVMPLILIGSAGLGRAPQSVGGGP